MGVWARFAFDPYGELHDESRIFEPRTGARSGNDCYLISILSISEHTVDILIDTRSASFLVAGGGFQGKKVARSETQKHGEAGN